MSANYYYEFRWNLYKFLKQSNGIPNRLDDGQLWNDYNSRGKCENKKPTPKKNGFNSYEQRNYDYDALEKLERQRNCNDFDPNEFEKLSDCVGRVIDEIY
ncbi:MAG: hypothetical protein PHY44_04185 [Lachnospiraceae bacterium]|nr:hypothetical protein [Lachnospiraceae bacterium]